MGILPYLSEHPVGFVVILLGGAILGNLFPSIPSKIIAYFRKSTSSSSSN